MLPLYFPLPKGTIKDAEEEEDSDEQHNEEEEEEEEEEEVNFEIKITDSGSPDDDNYKNDEIDPLLAENQEAEYNMNDTKNDENLNEAKNDENLNEAKNDENNEAINVDNNEVDKKENDLKDDNK